MSVVVWEPILVRWPLLLAKKLAVMLRDPMLVGVKVTEQPV